MINLIKKILQFLGIIAIKEETPEEKLAKIEKELNDLNTKLYYENQKEIEKMYAVINETANRLK